MELSCIHASRSLQVSYRSLVMNVSRGLNVMEPSDLRFDRSCGGRLELVTASISRPSPYFRKRRFEVISWYKHLWDMPFNEWVYVAKISVIWLYSWHFAASFAIPLFPDQWKAYYDVPIASQPIAIWQLFIIHYIMTKEWDATKEISKPISQLGPFQARI